MATEISGGGIYWKSGLDNSDFKKGVVEVESGFKRMENAAKASGDVLDKSISSRLGKDAATNIKILEQELLKYETTLKRVSGSDSLGGKGFEGLKSQIRAIGVELDAQNDKLKGSSEPVIIEQEKVVTATKKSAGGITNVVGKAFGFLRTAANLIPGLGLAGLIGAIATAVVEAAKKLKIFNKELTELEKTQKAIKTVNDAAIDGYVQQKVQMESLTDRVKKGGKSFKEKEDILKTYNKEFGDSIGKASSYSEAENYIIKSGPAFIESLRARANELAAMGLAIEAAKKSIEFSAKAPEEFLNTADSFFLKADKAQKKWFEGQFGFGWLAKEAEKGLEDAEIKGKIAQYNAVKAEDEKQKQMLAIYDKYRQIRERKEGSSTYNYGDGEKFNKAKAQTDKLIAAQERYNALQKEIAESATKFTFSDGLESEEEKINKFFDDLKAKIEKFNRDPRNKTKLGVDGIESNRSKALEDAGYVQETKGLLEELEVRKKEYQDYEEFKAKVGEDAANKQYAELIAKHKTYLERLQAEEDALANKGGLSAVENARYKQIQEERLKAQAQQKTDEKKSIEERIKAEANAYRQILDKANDFYQQKKNLEDEFNLQLKGLENDRNNLTEQEYERRKKIITGSYREALKDLEFNNADIFKKLNKDIGRASIGALIELYNDLDKIIKSGKMKNAAGQIVNVPPETLQRLVQSRDSIKGLITDTIKLKVQSSNFGKVAESMRDVGSALQSIGSGLDSAGFDGSIIGNIGNMVVTLSDSFMKINSAVKAFKDVASETGSAVKSLGQSKDWIAAILQLINVIVSMFGAMKRYKEELANLQRQVNETNADIYLAEFKISDELREQNLLRAQSIELTLKQLEATKKVLEENKNQTKEEAEALMAQINKVGEFIQSRSIKGRTWAGQLFGSKPTEVVNYGSFGSYALKDVEAQLKAQGLGSDTINRLMAEFKKQSDQFGNISKAILQDYAALEEKNWFGATTGHPFSFLNDTMTQLDKNGKRVAVTFAELKKLNTQGLLTGETKKLFDQLLELEKKGVDIDAQLKELQKQADEVFTGTTSNAILDSIVNGFKEGKRSAEDFAGTFEDLMREAMLNSLKYQYLEAPLQEWYKEFAAKASDGVVDSAEKAILSQSFNDIIQKGGQAAKLLESVTGISSDASKSKNKNNLSGAITQASQESIDLLAGHTMGARVAQLETNGHLVQMKDYAFRGLDYAMQTAANTNATVIELKTAVAELKGINGKMNNNANNALAAGL